MKSKFEHRFIFLQLLVLIFILSIWEWGWEFNQWLVEDYPDLSKVISDNHLDPFLFTTFEIWIRFRRCPVSSPNPGNRLFSIKTSFGNVSTKTDITFGDDLGHALQYVLGFSCWSVFGSFSRPDLGRSYVLAKIFEPFIVAFNSYRELLSFP